MAVGARRASSSPRDLTRLADKVVKERIQRVPGVGGVDLIGGREREIRVLVDPARLAGVGRHGAGRRRRDPRAEHGAARRLVRAAAAARSRSRPRARSRPPTRSPTSSLPGSAARACASRDVAEVVDGMEQARSASYLDGKSAVSLVIRKQSGANTVAVAHAVEKALEELRPRVEKAGATLAIPTDNAAYIERSIHDVQFDLMFGALLAVAIILLFLRDLRATLISAVAIPTSVVASVRVHAVAGLHVQQHDDARAVALDRHPDRRRDRRDREHPPPPRARRRRRWRRRRNGTAQIFLAVLATTSSILAVFVPVAFMKGIVGRFFFQFGMTVSVAVAVSMFVSFTLTPMLASRFLRKSHGEPARSSRAHRARSVGARQRLRPRASRWALRAPRADAGRRRALALVGSIVLVTQREDRVLAARGSRAVQRQRRAADRHARSTATTRDRRGGRQGPARARAGRAAHADDHRRRRAGPGQPRPDPGRAHAEQAARVHASRT